MHFPSMYGNCALSHANNFQRRIKTVQIIGLTESYSEYEQLRSGNGGGGVCKNYGKQHDEDILTKKNIAIYINGPALHHHLITTASRALSHCDLEDVMKEMVILATTVECVSSNTSHMAPTTVPLPLVTIPGIISLSWLYHLTTAFLFEFGSVATR